MEIVLNADITNFKSGNFLLFIGVGTVTIKKLQFFNLFSSEVSWDLFDGFNWDLLNSLFVSIWLFKLLILSLLVSKPITSNFF